MDYSSLMLTLMNYTLVKNNYRKGALVFFVPDDGVLYYKLDMGNYVFIVLNKNAPNELKTMAESLSDLWKTDKSKYHQTVGTLLGYTEPINILDNPLSDPRSVGIRVNGKFRGQPIIFQIAPQFVSKAKVPEALETLEALKTKAETIQIPAFELISMAVYDEPRPTNGGRKKKTTRRRR
jgi:hypothetical protein